MGAEKHTFSCEDQMSYDQIENGEDAGCHQESDVVIDDGIDYFWLNRIAFDEGNFSSLPFSLFTSDTSERHVVNLTSDGRVRIVCNNPSEYSFPNALAPRVALSLMWLWKNENKEQNKVFTVKLRDLVAFYMYPERFRRYAPGGRLMQSVEKQIFNLANSRVYTDSWYDKGTGKYTEREVGLIERAEVIQNGGENKPRIVEIEWTDDFFDSLNSGNTRAVDLEIYKKIDSPLELALYRLLNSKLYRRRKVSYDNVVDFARKYLGMTGAVIESGGKTASSYVIAKLKKCLERLNNLGFNVQMVISKIYGNVSAVSFERLNVEEVQSKARKKSKIRPGLRLKVFKRDGFKCLDCGKTPAADGVRLDIRPIDANKKLKIENLKTVCNLCNNKEIETDKPVTDSLRLTVMMRDKFKCVLCGNSPSHDNDVKLEVDHIIPRSKGGLSEMGNLQTLCLKCNRGKFTQIL